MKDLINYLLIFTLIFTSCNKDDGSSVESESEPEVPEIEITAIETRLISEIDPLQEEEDMPVDYLLDLEGQTIDVPAGVTFEFEGGDIFNGTLNFISDGKIDGELLNSELTVEGDVKLTSSEFVFYPERWKIVQEDVNGDVNIEEEMAENNHLTIQKTISLIEKIGVKDANNQTTFEIGKMDAYFKTSPISDIHANLMPIMLLPDNFHLKMSDDTTIRVFPLDNPQSSPAVHIHSVENVKVSGGHVIGDRLEHGPTRSTRTIVEVKGGENIVIDGLHTSFGTSAGIGVNGFLFEGNPDYKPSTNVLITNCVFDSHALGGVAITDGDNITIENSTFDKMGIDVDNPYGVGQGEAPRIAIVVEPVNGQRIDDVVIRNNTVTNSFTNSILAVGATNVLITENTTDSNIGWTTASQVEVSNNTIIGGGGIIAGYAGDEDSSGIIHGNTIKNAGTAMRITGDDVKVYDNDIIDSKIGAILAELKNSSFYDNTITSNIANAFAINAMFYGNEVTINNNTIKLNGESNIPFQWANVNSDEAYSEYKIYIKDNIIEATRISTMAKGNGYEIVGNTFTGAGLSLGDLKDVLVDKNTIVSNSGYPFHVNRTTSSQNIIITNNHFESTSDERSSADGVRFNKVGNNYEIEDSNILFEGNTVISVGFNYGLLSENFDGMTIKGNTFSSVERSPFNFIGDNSIITDNIFNSSNNKDANIEGVNNTILENKLNP